ncbi:sugar O-acetyltransferase [uncultured Dysosmobacter sp.]|uniref:sugar O-acetyltransferase n=1 Tax=uncultured Dysosmobacter sp. TaxID=2591384 RepID=UPI00262E3458|nr:sugar O-acetyltransferase [uncultured Dysosmobacter sp.]
MTEWDKIRAGLMYNDFADELYPLRLAAKKLFREYNRTSDDEIEKRENIMTELFESVGKHVWIEPDFRCEFGKNITIEDNVYINFGCIILDCAKVTISEHALLGPNIGIYPLNHAIDPEERICGACIGGAVHIGKRVWLGGDVKILAGVTIGDDAIIGAGSIVTRDIPAGVIAAGNPCKVIRHITDRDKTNFLRLK